MSAKTRRYVQEKRTGRRGEENFSPGCHGRFFSELLIRYRNKRVTYIHYIGNLGIRILWVTLTVRDGHPAKPIDKRREGRKRLSLVSVYNTGTAPLQSSLVSYYYIILYMSHMRLLCLYIYICVCSYRRGRWCGQWRDAVICRRGGRSWHFASVYNI